MAGFGCLGLSTISPTRYIFPSFLSPFMILSSLYRIELLSIDL
jgi:hypothetical protein